MADLRHDTDAMRQPANTLTGSKSSILLQSLRSVNRGPVQPYLWDISAKL